MVIISKCDEQPVFCYFIERKAKDNKANKDYNNLGSKTFSMFRYGHVQKLSKRLTLMEPTCWYVSEISLVHCTHVRFLVHHQFRRKCLTHALPRGNLYIMFISPWKVSEPLSMLFVMASTYFFITGICCT